MAVKRRQGSQTSVIFGRETDTTGSPITDKTKMIGRRYVVTAWNHDENSEKQESESLRGGRASTFGEDGFLWGDGDFEMEIPSEEGFLDVLQGVLADPTPVSAAVPEKTLVGAKTNVADIMATGYWTDSNNTVLKVLDDQDITSTDALTILDDLRSYVDALTLTVTPSSTPTLKAADTAAKVILVSIDAEGVSKTDELSFSDSAKTTAQTVALRAGARLKNVTATGWSAGKLGITTTVARAAARNPDPEHPGQLRFQFSAANASGKLIVHGTRKVGLASTDTLQMIETVALSANDNASKDVTLEKYFHKVSKVELLNGQGKKFTTGTVTVTSRPGGYETTLKAVDDVFPGWTMEAEVGGEPWVIKKAVPISASVDIGDNIRVTIDMLSSLVNKRRTIEGGAAEKFKPTAVTSPDTFPFVGQRFFPAYGRYLEIDGDAVIVDSVPISIEHNYDFASGKKAGRFRRDVEATGRRIITTSISTRYETGDAAEDVFVKWDEKFRNNEAVSVKIVTYQWLASGRQVAVIYQMPYCEITAPVRVAATDPGDIPVTIALKAVPPSGTTDGELRVTIISDDQWT